MKFQADKKTAIRQYILEKIDQGAESLTKTVAETFEINQNTAHSYVNELCAEGLIFRVKRGEYALRASEYTYTLHRSAGELKDDTAAYRQYLLPLISSFARNVQDIWAYAFSEMVNNVIDHSQCEELQLTISQTALKTTAYLLDDGIGIFENIRSHFHFDSLDEAVGELFKGKLTTDRQHHSGEGIFFSSKVMDAFLILSGDHIFACDKYSRNAFDVSPFQQLPGTLVIMSLSNTSRRQTWEVFEQYADTDDGFTKTKIPIKNMFDTVPVSRSQAKRVSYRLDQFREVEVDFSEVESMGQGFAHQLFVVFASEHPEVKLTATHMNETVEKMYRHVMAS